jgi:hypothetical protein
MVSRQRNRLINLAKARLGSPAWFWAGQWAGIDVPQRGRSPGAALLPATDTWEASSLHASYVAQLGEAGLSSQIPLLSESTDSAPWHAPPSTASRFSTTRPVRNIHPRPIPTPDGPWHRALESLSTEDCASARS